MIASIVGIAIFALPGTLTMFGIGASAAALVVTAAETLKLSILISTFGVTGTLGLVAAIPPAIALLTGVIRGIVGTCKAFVGLFTNNSRSDNLYSSDEDSSEESYNRRPLLREQRGRGHDRSDAYSATRPHRREKSDLNLFDQDEDSDNGYSPARQ